MDNSHFLSFQEFMAMKAKLKSGENLVLHCTSDGIVEVYTGNAHVEKLHKTGLKFTPSFIVNPEVQPDSKIFTKIHTELADEIDDSQIAYNTGLENVWEIACFYSHNYDNPVVEMFMQMLMEFAKGNRDSKLLKIKRITDTTGRNIHEVSIPDFPVKVAFLDSGKAIYTIYKEEIEKLP